MYCPDQLSRPTSFSVGPALVPLHADEAFGKIEDSESLARAKDRIAAMARVRFEQSREACQTDFLKRNLRAVINRVIDMRGLDECMVRSLSKATHEPIESFNAWRLLMRSDVELMMRAAENVGDHEAMHLGQVLLAHMARQKPSLRH